MAFTLCKAFAVAPVANQKVANIRKLACYSTAEKPAMPKRAFVTLAASALLVCATPAIAADLELGESVFEANCATCHSGGGNILIPDKTLQKAAIEKYLDGGFNVTAIVRQVTNGKGQMPAWRDVLDDEEIEAVANYVYATASSGW